MAEFSIGNRLIGKNHKPFIIAEMSGNHNQSLDRALEIVDAASEAGADAIKLQTYTADTMTLKGAYVIEDKDSLWNGRELHDLYKEAYTPWEWHKTIFDHAKKKNLIPFSSPFDSTAVDFLEELGVEIYKIASFENTDIPLLKKIASTGKPVIMSIGATNLSDIDEAVRTLYENGCKNLAILKCTSTYPSSPKNTNLFTIPHLQSMFPNAVVGLSDHTMGVGVPIASIALGARVIEKHFTLRRKDGGVDSAFSLEPKEMESLVVESERAFWALGKVQYGIQDAEKKSKSFKRSIYVAEDIKKGERFTINNLKVIRPAKGLPPKFYELVIGKTSKKQLKKGTPLKWDSVL